MFSCFHVSFLELILMTRVILLIVSIIQSHTGRASLVGILLDGFFFQLHRRVVFLGFVWIACHAVFLRFVKHACAMPLIDCLSSVVCRCCMYPLPPCFLCVRLVVSFVLMFTRASSNNSWWRLYHCGACHWCVGAVQHSGLWCETDQGAGQPETRIGRSVSCLQNRYMRFRFRFVFFFFLIIRPRSFFDHSSILFCTVVNIVSSLQQTSSESWHRPSGRGIKDPRAVFLGWRWSTHPCRHVAFTPNHHCQSTYVCHYYYALASFSRHRFFFQVEAWTMTKQAPLHRSESVCSYVIVYIVCVLYRISLNMRRKRVTLRLLLCGNPTTKRKLFSA